MRNVHIRNSVVNFWLVAEVPDRVINEPAFFRLRVKPRESKREADNILPFEKYFSELITQCEEDDKGSEGVDAA